MGGVFRPININLYRYAGLNPLKFTDPTGQSDEAETMVQQLRQNNKNSYNSQIKAKGRDVADVGTTALEMAAPGGLGLGAAKKGNSLISGAKKLWAKFFGGKGAKVIKGGLKGADKAKIDPRKLTEYALNPNHPVGGNKAKVFESALGFNKSNAGDLIKQLQKGVLSNTAMAGKVDKFGSRFTVDIPVTGPTGKGLVRTGWIYKTGSSIPELTTLFVK